MTNDITRKVLAHAGFKSALTHIDAGYDRFVDELITLTEIPAPPSGKSARLPPIWT
ncbi:hypothetical protein [Neorhizobium sp. DAR64872/K0K18]|uniref:hypothetical protein n=1 Tax=Neorhizobium sp. DAR64872/K0K18 TaxID=3421958 RepID=UPI003D2B68C0